MRTPIVDFLNSFVESSPTRLHMPGHKGKLGYERDITEVVGADSLYQPSGIILESEKYAGELFAADTFFSAEGSSLSIRAMLYLVSLYAKENGRKNKILAARNAHRSFFSAVALLDTELEFIGYGSDYLSAVVTPKELEDTLDLLDELPAALYVTSPDYLGRMQDVKALSEICHKRGMLLLVDNAHGAYLAFLKDSAHPIALGADMCADSAHKTLPALTGAGYLHISKAAPELLSKNAKGAMALFGSTSPSYLILESLDRLNGILNDEFRVSLSRIAELVRITKQRLSDIGYAIIDGEPMKITVDTREYGYSGAELGEILEKNNVHPEFYDRDHLVLMISADNSDGDLERLYAILSAIPKRDKITTPPVALEMPTRITSVREATLAPRESVSAELALGRVLAECSVSCPPAVPILVPGELVTAAAIDAFKYYGYDKISVIK